MRLLVVEDERELAETIAKGLRGSGYAVDLAFDGTEGEYKTGFTPYDLILLDLNLPGLDGVELCRRLRGAGSSAAVLMLTARDRIADRVAGLDSGADDYLVKPFSFDELQARIRALLRRAAAPCLTELRVGRLLLDPGARTAAFDGRALNLTTREFDILAHLMRVYPKVVSAEELLEHVWDEYADPFTNTVRVHLANLRRKLREAAGEQLIETAIGKGYRLCAS